MGALRGVCYVNVSSRCGVTVERRADRYGASVGHVNLLLATASLLPGAGTRAGAWYVVLVMYMCMLVGPFCRDAST